MEIKSTSADVFISYNWNCGKLVERLYAKLTSLGISVWRDIINLNQTSEPLTLQLGFKFVFILLVGQLHLRLIGRLIYKANAISGCKIFMCLITSAYYKSRNCNLEIEYANTLKKKMIILMIENLRIEELGAIGFIIK